MPDSARPIAHALDADEPPRACARSGARGSLGRLALRLARWRERQLLRNALVLAGEPTLVLDLHGADGQYWPVLAEKPNRIIIAAGSAVAGIDAERARQPLPLQARIRTLRSGIRDIALPDGAVDCVVCMHAAENLAEARQLDLLPELRRVSRDTLILSLNVDGGLFPLLRRKRPVDVLPSEHVRRAFAEAGLRQLARFDLLPLHAMQRVFVLRKRAA